MVHDGIIVGSAPPDFFYGSTSMREGRLRVLDKYKGCRISCRRPLNLRARAGMHNLRRVAILVLLSIGMSCQVVHCENFHQEVYDECLQRGGYQCELDYEDCNANCGSSMNCMTYCITALNNCYNWAKGLCYDEVRQFRPSYQPMTPLDSATPSAPDMPQNSGPDCVSQWAQCSKICRGMIDACSVSDYVCNEDYRNRQRACNSNCEAEKAACEQ